MPSNEFIKLVIALMASFFIMSLTLYFVYLGITS